MISDILFQLNRNIIWFRELHKSGTACIDFVIDIVSVRFRSPSWSCKVRHEGTSQEVPSQSSCQTSKGYRPYWHSAHSNSITRGLHQPVALFESNNLHFKSYSQTRSRQEGPRQQSGTSQVQQLSGCSGWRYPPAVSLSSAIGPARSHSYLRYYLSRGIAGRVSQE